MGHVIGRTVDGRSESNGRRHRRMGALAVLLATCTAMTVGCDSGRIVNTEDTITPTSAAAPPPPSTHPTNDGLANAFDFAAQPDGVTGYYFTSPSKRWVCAIIPRERVGCQSSTGSRIAIIGAPDSVADAQGEARPPNAIQVDRVSDAQFASVDVPGYALVPGPAAVLPFGKVLTVAGFRCNVQEATGISCLSELTGKGFTFSSDGYTLRYTDLPM